MAIAVVIPSRGRPARAKAAVVALRDTAVRPDTSVILAVDEDDPLLPEYRVMVHRLEPPRVGSERRPTLVVLAPDDTGDLVRATNTVSMRIARDDPTAIIGNLGDDHLARTVGWDRQVIEALDTPGIAYGDDLLQGERVPTAPFISASIVNALGWYALPCCSHMYIDDAWKALGLACGFLRYLPDMVIEHVHPALQKAEWDDGYERAHLAMEPDHRAYDRWRNSTYHLDVANIRRCVP